MSTAAREITDPTERPLIPVHEMCHLADASRATLYQWVKQGIIPKPVKLGRRVYWRRSDVAAYIANLDPHTPSDQN